MSIVPNFNKINIDLLPKGLSCVCKLASNVKRYFLHQCWPPEAMTASIREELDENGLSSNHMHSVSDLGLD